MGGGEMQLLAPASTAEAAQMEYIVGSPQMSYFKSVYKRHKNFAMESIRESFSAKPMIDQITRNKFTCTFTGRRADALKEIYFCFELPDIYSDDTLRFQWIDKLANYLVYRCSITLDNGRSIDEQYGEWMDIWNSLTLGDNKREFYDKMVGNDNSAPLAKHPRIKLRNNRLEYKFYPVGQVGSPSIPGRKYFIPLPFWFTRNPNLVLPLCALKLQTVSINIETRALNDLYQVFDAARNEYVSPSTLINRYTGVGDVSIGRFLSPPVIVDDTLNISTPDVPIIQMSAIDLNAYLECQYIYLDRAERTEMTLGHHKMLVEQVFRFDFTGLTSRAVVNLQLNNPVKELVWVARRMDANKRNEWSKFTERDGSSILQTGSLVWQKNHLRVEEKPAEFFQYMQPWQHHTGSPRAGIHAYSFALFPEKLQPSGAYNTGIITANQLVVTSRTPPEEDVQYEVICYAIAYNVFEAMSGIGHMKFTP